MKKLISVAFASLAAVAVASSYSPNIGVTQISTTNKNTIVAVPFTSLSNGDNISVTDLVCTNGLESGTYIYVFKDNSYKAWSLGDSGWVPANIATLGSEISTPAAGDDLVASPGAIWVILKTAPVEAKTFCIYGQYTNVTESAIVAGSNLIANPLQSAASVSVAMPVAGDQIIIPGDSNPVSYTYSKKRNAETGNWTSNGAVATLPSVAVGQGLWYVRKSGSAATTITWQ